MNEIGGLDIDTKFDEDGDLFVQVPCDGCGVVLTREQVKQLRDLLTKLLEEDGE